MISVTVEFSNLNASAAQRYVRTTSGTSAPTTTPERIGDVFIDTNNKKLYFATGTSSSGDWTIAN